MHGWKVEFRVIFRADVDTTLECDAVASGGEQSRAGSALDLRDSAGVIEVRVRVEQNFHVAQPESEAPDIPLDHGCVLRQPDIEQDVALRRRDQPRGESGAADVIDVVDDAERCDGVGPRCR